MEFFSGDDLDEAYIVSLVYPEKRKP